MPHRIGAVIATVFGVLLASGTAAAMSWEEALGHWQAVLDRYVDDEGRTAFAALAQDARDLDAFVGYLAEVSPRSAPESFATREQQLAYYVNAYNALAMHGVIAEGIPRDFGSFFKRAGFFKLRDVTLGGERTNLYDLENDRIRPYGEPRVHFALNCMVRDCPRLPREAFRAERLDAQLDAVTREFFAKPRHLRIDDESRTVWVSEILKFYIGDFDGAKRAAELRPYINRYRDDALPDGYRIRFIRYDWTVNAQP